MRSVRVLVAATVLLGAAGCTGAGGGAGAAPSGGSAARPAPAGSAEARELTALPAGPATGTAVVSYTGVGEVRAPFDGECSHTGDTTRLDGSADTARIRLDVGPDGARLVLDDLGLSATADLTTGRYEVVGDHLGLAAGLEQAGQTIGSVHLEVDCGG
ncbi:hypothetical protein SAMN06893096_101311 [Geodermatophilus pulveris]|uniref:Lipoprotein n=1 Tax=Geodermatophilus pulveris TaxID=1564159 RepID=A0A239AYY0_9ACTN|nr:hypothetical protein [Geodermatophilus pulveris]SNS00571.1 hypothetical protein SAMN06893096_101311 [Geodermatophilus pulveris]